jgi:hypothetical protein
LCLIKAISLVSKQLEYNQGNILAAKYGNSIHILLPDSLKNLKWTGSVAEYVEWVYALYLAESINDGEITLTRLFRIFNEIFNMEVTTYSRTFIDICNREEHTQFLNKQTKCLIERMEENDNKQAKKKKRKTVSSK